MQKIEIQDRIKRQKSALRDIGDHILKIVQRFNIKDEIGVTLQDQIEHIQENFLFVIVGEVNSGKSSAVNALLGEQICETSQAICTMDVQKIIYGAQQHTMRNDVKRILIKQYPAEILKEITIVDTPGTNSRELDHQIITENFIPYCNLIVFVFQMDNIHVQSAWDLLRKIKDKWSKKLIFVLTKSDRYTQEELVGYKNLLLKYTQEEHIQDPQIFITSAQKETQGLHQESGFPEIRSYINEQVLKNSAYDKLTDDLKTIKILRDQIHEEFDARKTVYQADRATRDKIQLIIQEKENLAFSDIQSLVNKCVNTVDRINNNTLSKFKEGIGFFNITFKSIKAIFGGESTTEWLQQIKTNHLQELNTELNSILQDGADNIKSDIQYMVMGVKNELDNLQEKTKSKREMFDQIDAARTDIIIRLKSNLMDFIEKSSVFKGEHILKNKIDYSAANIGVGIATVGAVITAISSWTVADVTGGIATGLGLVIAGSYATLNRNKFMRVASDALNASKKTLQEELDQNLKKYMTEIKDNINGQFADFDHHLEIERTQIEAYDGLNVQILKDISQLEQEIFLNT